MAFRVITRFMGIPVEDEPQILDWGSRLLRFAWEPEPALDAAAKIRGYLVEVVSERRCEPGIDLISELTRAEFEGRRLDDQEIVTAILALFAAGTDSPANAIGNLIAAVLSEPDLEARVRVEPDILPGLTEELLRFVPSPALMPRKCPKASHWRGIDFPENSSAIFGITSANRDPDAFPDPDRFDPDRKMDRAILSFGQGTHLCVGAHLARSEIQVALRTLLERLPDIRLTQPGSVETIGGVFRGPRALSVVFGSRS
jgi:cytochrome P450